MEDLSQNRFIKLEGAVNFRDLGGYPVPGGRRIVWRKVFRSDDLSRLTPADVELITNLGVKTYIDFRDKFEVREAPDIIAPGVQYHLHLPIDTGVVLDMLASDQFGDSEADDFMLKIYESVAVKFASQYRRFFAYICDYSRSPLIFHCMAGKDRTGVAAVLFLAALGVERDRIIEDYLFTARKNTAKFDNWLGAPVRGPVSAVARRYLDRLFLSIERDFGTMDHYLERGLLVDRKLLREIYTEPVR